MRWTGKREGTSIDITTHDRSGKPVVVHVAIDSLVRCPECRRNQPAENLPYHMAYQHRRN